MKKKRKGNRKGKGGRKPDSGVVSGIEPGSEQWSDICNRVIHGSAEWRIVRLRELIGDGSRLADNHLSSRRAERNAAREEIDVLWGEWSAECERAMLDGDADWFARQAKAIAKGGLPQQRAQFNAKVVHLLELAFWETWAKQRAEQERKGRHMESATLTPAGKFTDAMASDIWKAVVRADLEEPKRRSLIEQQLAVAESYGLGKASRNKKPQIIEQVVAESYGFKTKECAMDAIRDFAERLRFELRKQH
jgi:hypothetical protein